jgi:putative Mg2+ transporter-C (MgtC) family protein
MQAIANINLVSFADTTISLVTAFILGGLIGVERQYRQRTAGLRTNVLVAVGSAIFVDMANRLGNQEGAVHVIAYVVSGIGFLGAGVIMREEGNVRGLNTAATLWGSAAVGACAGADLILEAILGTIFVLSANTLLRPIVNRINRQPIDTVSVEATHTMIVITPKTHHRQALASLESALEQAGLPISELNVHAFGAESIEIEATLSSASIDSNELDLVITRLLSCDHITQAFWNSSTAD